jgi:hypothetical protein
MILEYISSIHSVFGNAGVWIRIAETEWVWDIFFRLLHLSVGEIVTTSFWRLFTLRAVQLLVLLLVQLPSQSCSEWCSVMCHATRPPYVIKSVLDWNILVSERNGDWLQCVLLIRSPETNTTVCHRLWTSSDIHPYPDRIVIMQPSNFGCYPSVAILLLLHCSWFQSLISYFCLIILEWAAICLISYSSVTTL